MPVTWPSGSDFPQAPLYEGYEEQMPSNVVRTAMETGPEKTRRRFTAAPRPFKFMVAMTPAQLVIFDSFYVESLEGGALPFEWVHPRTQSAATFKFTAPPGIQRRGPDTYFVSLELNLQP